MKLLKIISLILLLALLCASAAYAYELRPEAYWGERGWINALESVYTWLRNMVLVGIVGGVYLLPTLIAIIRSHNKLAQIAALNVFLGVIVIGWIGALIWSFSGNVHPQNFLDRFGSTA